MSYQHYEPALKEADSLLFFIADGDMSKIHIIEGQSVEDVFAWYVMKLSERVNELRFAVAQLRGVEHG